MRSVIAFLAILSAPKWAYAAEDEVHVRAATRAPSAGSTEVTTDDAVRVPGTRGDALSVLESLPGVQRAPLGSGQLVVWGAQDTRVFLNDVPLPTLYHAGGYRSVVHSDMIRSVELVPGGYRPMYGRGLGGIIAAKLRDIDEPGVHGSVGADVLDASGSIRAELGARWHVALSLRRSHLDDLLSAANRSDVAEVLPISRYRDGQARIRYAASPNESIEAGGLFSTDATELGVISADPLATKRERRESDFGRLWLRYDRRVDAATVSAVPFFGDDRSRLVSSFGPTPVELDVRSRVFGFRASWSGPLVRDVRAAVGLDALFTASDVERVGSLGAPPREGDVRHFGQRPPEQINADRWKPLVGSLAPYGELDIPLAKGLFHLLPGARIEPYLTATNRKTPRVGEVPPVGSARQETVVEPRVAVRFAPLSKMSMTASYGQYHQSPAPDDLSPVFGSPTLGVARAQHWTLGLSFKPVPTIDVELTEFFITSAELATRAVGAWPALAHALEARGEGRSRGAQLLLRRRRVGRFLGWIAYTLSRSERRDIPTDPWRLFDYDQTHVLTGAFSYDLGAGFGVGLRVRYATGSPRTPVAAAVYDDKSDSYIPAFAAQNSARHPAFFSLDARASKHFRIGPTVAEIYVEVLNATDRRNVEQIVYSPSYAKSSSVTGLPFLPMAGARWAW